MIITFYVVVCLIWLSLGVISLVLFLFLKQLIDVGKSCKERRMARHDEIVDLTHKDDVFVLREVAHEGIVLRDTKSLLHWVSIGLEFVQAGSIHQDKAQRDVQCVVIKVSKQEEQDIVALIVEAKRLQEWLVVDERD